MIVNPLSIWLYDPRLFRPQEQSCGANVGHASFCSTIKNKPGKKQIKLYKIITSQIPKFITHINYQS